jgi:tetraacyldisaccharide 4'-kinase
MLTLRNFNTLNRQLKQLPKPKSRILSPNIQHFACQNHRKLIFIKIRRINLKEKSYIIASPNRLTIAANSNTCLIHLTIFCGKNGSALVICYLQYHHKYRKSYNMNQDFYHRLVSGQKKGCFAALLKMLLTALAQIYSIIITLRNLMYNTKILKTHHKEAIIISIGNITTGGTGKTPLAVWLCNLLLERKINSAILTRGYKTTKSSKHSKVGAGEVSFQNYFDEPAILSEECPNSKIVVNPDRVAGAAEAISKFAARVLIMDDGFQHRRLTRNLDIITIDSTLPFGYGKILPAGLLREPINSLKRADAVVITRCDQTTASELDKIENKLQAINPDMVIARSAHAVVGIKAVDGNIIEIKNIKGKKIFAFCGIGNPNTFLNTIKSLGTELAGSKIHNDHHRYTQACLADIYKQAGDEKVDLILTTQKDWTKIKHLTLDSNGIPLAYLKIKIKFLKGEDKLRHLIEEALAGKISKK